MYEELSLIELKKKAKTYRIKQYYIMKKDELVRLLNMKELPEKYRIEKLTIQQLREKAKEKGMKGFWNLSKQELLDILFPPHDQKKDNSETCEHQDPQNQDSD
jgi:acetyl-CoA carboxylase carboxyltransferase component